MGTDGNGAEIASMRARASRRLLFPLFPRLGALTQALGSFLKSVSGETETAGLARISDYVFIVFIVEQSYYQ